MQSKRRNLLWTVLTVALVGACRGGRVTGPGPAPAPSSFRESLKTGSFFDCSSPNCGVGVFVGPLTRPGTLEVEFTWRPPPPDADGTIELFSNNTEPNACPRSCPDLLASSLGPGHPKVLTYPDAQQGKGYFVIVRTRGPVNVVSGEVTVWFTAR